MHFRCIKLINNLHLNDEREDENITEIMTALTTECKVHGVFKNIQIVNKLYSKKIFRSVNQSKHLDITVK